MSIVLLLVSGCSASRESSAALTEANASTTPTTITGSLEQGIGWEFVQDPVCLVSKLPQPNPRLGNDREVVMRFHVLNRNSTAISISVVVDTELRYTDGWSDESIISFEGVEIADGKSPHMVLYNKLVVPGGPGIFDVDLRAVVGPQVSGTTSRCLYSWQVIGVSLA